MRVPAGQKHTLYVEVKELYWGHWEVVRTCAHLHREKRFIYVIRDFTGSAVLTKTILLGGTLSRLCALPFVAAFANENAVIIMISMSTTLHRTRAGAER